MVDVDEADELESAGEEEDQLEDDVDEPEPEPEAEVEPEQEDGEEDEVEDEEGEGEGEGGEELKDRMVMDEEDLAEDKKRAKLGPGTESKA